jgi:hypothetical protein
MSPFFLGKRLGLKNDAAQSRQFTVRDYVVDLHSANANVLIRPGLLNTGAWSLLNRLSRLGGDASTQACLRLINGSIS